MLSPFVAGYLITQVLTKQKMIPSMFQEGINSYISANRSARISPVPALPEFKSHSGI